MRRRALLASAAAGVGSLAGCLGTLASDAPAGDDGNDSDDSPGAAAQPGNETVGEAGNESGTEAGTDDLEPPEDRTSVVDLETLPRTYALSPTSVRTDDDGRVALWFDRTATDESPARLTGFLENANDYENTFDLQWIPGVGAVHSRTPSGYAHEARLHLAPTERNELAEDVPTPTRGEDGSWQVVAAGPWMREHVRLAPGERVRLEYVLVGESGAPGRPTGTYEFSGRDEQLRIAVWDAEHPGPDADSRFAGRSVPPIQRRTRGDDGDDPIEPQWFHEATESTVAYLRPERERVELDAAIDFEFVYNARESSGCGHWDLYKLVDSEWFHVAPNGHNLDCRQVGPGARMEWTLRAFQGSPVPGGDEGIGCGGALTRGYLGGGTYAVVVGYGHPAEDSAALLELVGDRVELEPTDDATVERDGGEIVVTTEAYGDGEHPPDATLIVEPVDADGTESGEQAERVIAEQLLGTSGSFDRSSALRNAIATIETGVDRSSGSNVERVVVRTDERDVDGAVGYDESTRRVRFRGQTYELTAERSES